MFLDAAKEWNMILYFFLLICVFLVGIGTIYIVVGVVGGGGFVCLFVCVYALWHSWYEIINFLFIFLWVRLTTFVLCFVFSFCGTRFVDRCCLNLASSWNVLFSPSIVIEHFSGYNSLGWHVVSYSVYVAHLSWPFHLLESLLKSQVV